MSSTSKVAGGKADEEASQDILLVVAVVEVVLLLLLLVMEASGLVGEATDDDVAEFAVVIEDVSGEVAEEVPSEYVETVGELCRNSVATVDCSDVDNSATASVTATADDDEEDE